MTSAGHEVPRFVAAGGDSGAVPATVRAAGDRREECPMAEMEDQEPRPEEQGTYDLQSMLYVLGGVPFMIIFFVALFLLVGSCDQSAVYIHA